jgi:FkbM family methyltransferase
MWSLPLSLAQSIAGTLPPLFAARARDILLPKSVAYEDHSRYRVRSRTGSTFDCGLRDFCTYPFAVNGFFEWRTWALALALTEPGDTVVEVGANVGTETIGFLDVVGARGRVFSFEADPVNVERLKTNLSAMSTDRLEIIPYAVGASEGLLRFSSTSDTTASGCGHVVSNGEGTIEVRCVPLDSMIDRFSRLRYVHMDIEGAECMALRGARQTLRRYRPAIFTEVGQPTLNALGESIESLRALLVEEGYELFAVNRLRVDPVNPHQSFESDYAANWLALPKESAQADARRANWALLRCGLLPNLPGINPFQRSS